MIILNSLIVTKNVKGGFWAFSTSLQLQNIKKMKGEPFGDKKISKKSLIAPKQIERGDPLVSSGFVGYVKKVKNEEVFWRQKMFRKKSLCAKKNRKGDSFSPVRFCRLPLKSKKERGNLWTRFALAPDLALGVGGVRIVSEKWTDQCEDCRLKKTKVTAIVGHFSLKDKAPTKNRHWEQVLQNTEIFTGVD